VAYEVVDVGPTVLRPPLSRHRPWKGRSTKGWKALRASGEDEDRTGERRRGGKGGRGQAPPLRGFRTDHVRQGYPIAPAEAHERAVVRGPEREAFFQLVENTFVREDMPATQTRKAVSKRTRVL